MSITGVPSHSSSGKILATSMVQTGQTSTINLPELIINYLLPSRAVLPRDAVYSPGQSVEEALRVRRSDVETSREAALAAGVRQAGIKVSEGPKIVNVGPQGPAYQILEIGDFIVAIDDTPMSTAHDVRQYIRNNKQVGDQIVVTVLRNQETLVLSIPKLQGSSTDGTVPTMGTTVGTGYLYAPEIRFRVDVDSGAPSEGLALALTTYDMLTETDVIDGAIIAAAGRVAASGEVTPVVGISEHAHSAANARAELFFMPRLNCSDLHGDFTGMTIIPVESLTQVEDALKEYVQGGARIPRC
jgi:PDZ domain-containing protein